MPVPRALTADLWGTWICRETFYASVERHRVRCVLSGARGWSGEPSMPIDPQGFKPSMSLPSATRSVACSLGYMDPQENLRCLSRVPQGPFGVHGGTRTDGQGSLLCRTLER